MRSQSLLARKETYRFRYIPSLEDYTAVAILGRGTFGDVFAAQSKSDVSNAIDVSFCIACPSRPSSE